MLALFCHAEILQPSSSFLLEPFFLDLCKEAQEVALLLPRPYVELGHDS